MEQCIQWLRHHLKHSLCYRKYKSTRCYPACSDMLRYCGKNFHLRQHWPISNLVALSPVALMISGKEIWLTCQIRKCSITVTRWCWLSLKSFQTLHGLSRWRTKLAILLSKPLQKFWAEAGWKPCFCTRTVVSSSTTSFFNATLRRHRFTF